MTIAFICIVIAVFIPLLCAGYAKTSKKGYNNNDPRGFLEGLEGKAKRAHYAQLNSFENFPPFAAAVIIAYQLQANQGLVDMLAVTFVCMRGIYCLLYINDMPKLRSTAWFLGFFATLGIFYVGLSK